MPGKQDTDAVRLNSNLPHRLVDADAVGFVVAVRGYDGYMGGVTGVLRCVGQTLLHGVPAVHMELEKGATGWKESMVNRQVHWKYQFSKKHVSGFHNVILPFSFIVTDVILRHIANSKI